MKLAFVLAILVLTPILHADDRIVVDRQKHEIRIKAIAQPDAMERWLGVRGHHAIVWDKGRAARWALFRSLASDHEVRVALDQLGAKAGENLTVETWTKRDDTKNPEPDKRVEGTPVDVFVEWKGGGGPKPLASLISQKGTAAPQLDFRYGGNERWQETFHSGCIVCLYSCPGGAIGNHSRTIRDYVNEGVIYHSRPGDLPADGTVVTLILKPKAENR